MSEEVEDYADFDAWARVDKEKAWQLQCAENGHLQYNRDGRCWCGLVTYSNPEPKP